jgi:hypothetical protein
MVFIGYGLHGAGETRSTRTTGARVDRAGLRDTEGGQRRSAALRCTAARPGLAVHGHGKVAVRAHYWALGPVDHGAVRIGKQDTSWFHIFWCILHCIMLVLGFR